MKLKLFISVLLLSILFTQDRATIFSTGSDEPNPAFGGYPIQYIEEEVECFVKIVSVGPQRHETILR